MFVLIARSKMYVFIVILKVLAINIKKNVMTSTIYDKVKKPSGL